jgi:hypothetical protein
MFVTENPLKTQNAERELFKFYRGGLLHNLKKFT